MKVDVDKKEKRAKEHKRVLIGDGKPLVLSDEMHNHALDDVLELCAEVRRLGEENRLLRIDSDKNYEDTLTLEKENERYKKAFGDLFDVRNELEEENERYKKALVNNCVCPSCFKCDVAYLDIEEGIVECPHCGYKEAFGGDK